MDYEKAYKEAWERARKLNADNMLPDEAIEEIFPELAESEDEKIRKHLIEIVETYWGKTNEPGKAADLAWLEKQAEQKPVEWSEEDEKAMDWLLECLASWKYQVPEYKDEYQVTYDWLESLPERFVLQPKKEWSKEDEKMMKDIDLALRKLYDTSTRLRIETWLKSFHPQSHWKPSEYHLSALLAVLNDPDNIGSQTCQLALSDLYEQLKEL